MTATPERKGYPSDLADEEWFLIAPLVAQAAGPGRPRTVDIREIVNAILYLNKSGCQWDMLPHDFPDYRHVNYYYLEWTRNGIWDQVMDALRGLVRVFAGKQPQPTAAVIDSQSVKTASSGEGRGYDVGKQVKGRKRHIAVDTLGCLLLVLVTRASLQDRDGGFELCTDIQLAFGTIAKIWADHAYAGDLVEYARRFCRFVLEIVKRPGEQRGFQVQPKRWIVERTLGWLTPFRRLSKDYETTTGTDDGRARPAPYFQLSLIDERNEFFDALFVCCVATEPGLKPALFASRLEIEKDHEG
jgi:putative transposase